MIQVILEHKVLQLQILKFVTEKKHCTDYEFRLSYNLFLSYTIVVLINRYVDFYFF